MTTEAPLFALLNKLEKVRKSGAGYSAACPAHPDTNPSLSVTEGDEKILVRCQAGCETEAVLGALRMSYADLFTEPAPTNGHRSEIIATYDYLDAAGALVFQVVRKSPKGFYQRRPDGKGGWANHLGPCKDGCRTAKTPHAWLEDSVERVLYNLPDVIAAVAADVTIYVVEGEKDANALAQAGEVATTNAGGAGKWDPAYAKVLEGAEVVIVADQDAAGEKHAAEVKASLVGVAKKLTVVAPAVGKDAADHLGAGRTVEEFVAADVGQSGLSAQTGLAFLTARELAAEVDAAPPVGFLCRPVWPADAYGVLAAEDKAGKTWASLDKAVSVASGTPWLAIYAVERQGPVLLFLGEGGKRKMLRRRAICASRGLCFEDLPIVLCFKVPHLASAMHLATIAEQVQATHPALVIIDPLYLAAKGATSSDLTDMGAHLSNVQGICQDAGAALAIVHHWNKTGKGSGRDRMSGAGPAAWGRVLVSVSVEARSTDKATGTTSVTLGWQFVGDEIPDTEIRIRRKVWAEDPDDLNSALHYEVEELEAKGADPGPMRPATARVLVVLRAAGVGLSVSQIGDDLAKDPSGIPLRARTIQTALKELESLHLAESEALDGRTYLWRAQSAPDWGGKCL
ncbi:MAG: AAA family ATPase [Actinomycetota bacterium]|nr:AAA family ATPase [Actinomycetota bacterium]